MPKSKLQTLMTLDTSSLSLLQLALVRQASDAVPMLTLLVRTLTQWSSSQSTTPAAGRRDHDGYCVTASLRELRRLRLAELQQLSPDPHPLRHHVALFSHTLGLPRSPGDSGATTARGVASGKCVRHAGSSGALRTHLPRRRLPQALRDDGACRVSVLPSRLCC